MSFDPLSNRDPSPPPTLSPSPSDKNIYDGKLFTMLDLICQHTWNCDFDGHVHRWYFYGDEFGYSHQMTVSLIDYGTALDGDDSKILIVCCNGTETIILKRDDVDVSETFQGPESRVEVIC
ncbi:hypothetical protein ABHI18_008072 [Aspergillus niger]